MTVCSVGLYILSGSGPAHIRINVPASNMKQSVSQFRDEFENNYLNPRRSIPLFSMMYQSGVTPINVADEARIGKTGSGKARVGIFSSDSVTITSDALQANGVAFEVLFQNKLSKLVVDYPASVSAQIVTDASPTS